MTPPPTTKERVKDMTAGGLSPRQIAAALGISTQAVYKHLKALNEEERASA